MDFMSNISKALQVSSCLRVHTAHSRLLDEEGPGNNGLTECAVVSCPNGIACGTLLLMLSSTRAPENSEGQVSACRKLVWGRCTVGFATLCCSCYRYQYRRVVPYTSLGMGMRVMPLRLATH